MSDQDIIETYDLNKSHLADLIDLKSVSPQKKEFLNPLTFQGCVEQKLESNPKFTAHRSEIISAGKILLKISFKEKYKAMK